LPDRQETSTDHDGNFSIEVPPDTWRLVARAAGFLPATEEGLSVTAGERVGGILLTLEPGQHITGTVDFEGTPQSAKIVATGEGFVRSGSTDELGHFTIAGLPKGTFSVRAYHEGLGGDEKTVETGGSVHLSLGYRQKIRGRVLDGRGFPAPGLAVFSDYSPNADPESDPYPHRLGEESHRVSEHSCGSPPGCYQRAVTRADGRFELDAAPGETLTVGARVGDHYAIAYDVQSNADDLVLELRPPERAQLVRDDGVALTEPLRATLSRPVFFSEELVSDLNGWISLPPFGRTLTLPWGAHFVEARPLIRGRPENF
jgi:hypothetical protein